MAEPKGMARGEAHGLAKLNTASVRKIRQLSALGFSQRAIARMIRVSPSAVGMVLRGQTWVHVK